MMGFRQVPAPEEASGHEHEPEPACKAFVQELQAVPKGMCSTYTPLPRTSLDTY